MFDFRRGWKEEGAFGLEYGYAVVSTWYSQLSPNAVEVNGASIPLTEYSVSGSC